MDANEHLAPAWIVYVDGVRLDTACEGAFRDMRVFDLLNKIGVCEIEFDYLEIGWRRPKWAAYGSGLSVCLGYKDNAKEVFNGEITGDGIALCAQAKSYRYKVKAMTQLWRMDSIVHRRTFENKTPSQAIKQTLGRYNIKAECEEFGPQRDYWQEDETTDWELVLGLAKRYGKDIYCSGDNVYVKELMTMHKEEYIYEWGKSLMGFEAREYLGRQAGAVRVIGWNQGKAKGSRHWQRLMTWGRR